jgi:hypothetical protein
MLVWKASRLMQLKLRWEQQRKLEAQIETIVAQLEQTASPEIASQVETMMLSSARASMLISHEDAGEIKARASVRRSSSVLVSATADLVSVGPGVSGSLLAGLAQVSLEHPVVVRASLTGSSGSLQAASKEQSGF